MPKTTTGLSTYTKSDLSKVEWSKRFVEQELQDHVGRENGISAKELAALTPVSESTIRDIIQMLRAEGYAIGSSPKYYLIETTEEYIDELDRINDTIATYQERKAHLVEAWNDGGGG